MKVCGYTRCAVTMFGLECILHLTLEFTDVLRFVFTKSRPRTRYKSLFLVFSGKLHDAIMSGQVSMTVENVFVENNIFGECVFWTLTVRMMFLCFLDVDGENDVFGNRLEFVLPRMTYLLDNNNFQTALYFKPFCMMMFLERSVYFLDWRRYCRILEWCICNVCKCMWMSLFLFSLQLEFAKLWRTMCMYARTWFKHVARQNKRDKDNTAQRLADSLRHFTCLFVCCEKKVRARSSENLWVFDLRVFASCIHRHRRLGSDPTRRNGVRERRGKWL